MNNKLMSNLDVIRSVYCQGEVSAASNNFGLTARNTMSNFLEACNNFGYRGQAIDFVPIPARAAVAADNTMFPTIAANPATDNFFTFQHDIITPDAFVHAGLLRIRVNYQGNLASPTFTVRIRVSDLAGNDMVSYAHDISVSPSGGANSSFVLTIPFMASKIMGIYAAANNTYTTNQNGQDGFATLIPWTRANGIFVPAAFASNQTPRFAKSIGVLMTAQQAISQSTTCEIIPINGRGGKHLAQFMVNSDPSI